MSITLLDGAVGTSLWAKAEARGIKKVPVWRYNIEHPELVTELAKDYAEAGAKIILANTFGANRIAVKRTNYSVSQVVTEGVKLAKAAIAGADAKLALAAGPLTEFMEPYGDLEEEDVDEIYTEMFEAGIAAGAQCITIQTFMELEMMRVAATAAKRFSVSSSAFSFSPSSASSSPARLSRRKSLGKALTPAAAARSRCAASFARRSAIKRFSSDWGLPWEGLSLAMV